MKKILGILISLVSASYGYNNDVHVFSNDVKEQMKFFLEMDPQPTLSVETVFQELQNSAEAYKLKEPVKAQSAISALCDYQASYQKKQDFDGETNVNITDLLVRTWEYARLLEGVTEALLEQIADSHTLCLTGRTNRIFQIYRMKFE